MSFSFSRVFLGGFFIASSIIGVAVADDDRPLLEGDEPYLTYEDLTADTRLPKREAPAVDQAYAADPTDSYVTERRDSEVAEAPRRPRPLYAQATPYCREYRTTVMSGGQERYAYGTACRQPDGAWKIVSAPTLSWSSARADREPEPPYRGRYRYYPNLFDR